MKPNVIRKFLFVLVIFPFVLFANNIQVANVSLESQVAEEQYTFIEFDISWDNSWRTTAVPNNWDAAWVFVKYSIAGGEWGHASLNTTGQIPPSGSAIDVSSDGTGAFIYRSADGNGTVNWTDARLRWNYGIDGVPNDAGVEIRIFAIEMVYVPEGSYSLGDGFSDSHFYKTDDLTVPYTITSENVIPLSAGAPEQLLAENGFDLGTLPNVIAEYPKGYEAVYCMKYEISQEQYKEFLNTLTRAQQNTRTLADISGTSVADVFVISAASGPANRNGIRCDPTLSPTGPITLYCDLNNNGSYNESDDGQNVACNFLSFMDLAAYLDWAGLRPATELEFEKICRGLNPAFSGEYVWGNTNLSTEFQTPNNPGDDNEYLSNPQSNTGMAVFNVIYGDPLRCGIFAASSYNNTRQEAGATYFGVMEMGGNLTEQVVTAQNPSGRSFRGHHGDGSLTTAGDANVDYWPGINGNTSNLSESQAYLGGVGVTTAIGSCNRGGSIAHGSAYLRISDRKNSNIHTETLESYSGGRGVRTSN